MSEAKLAIKQDQSIYHAMENLVGHLVTASLTIFFLYINIFWDHPELITDVKQNALKKIQIFPLLYNPYKSTHRFANAIL